MLDECIEPGELASARGRRSAYRSVLAGIVESVGVERAARESGVDADRLAGLGTTGSDPLTLADAAAVLALSDSWPGRAVVERELRDDLVVGMSNAALDAATVARAAGPGVDAETIRAAVDGSRDLPLPAYARIRHVVATEGRE